MKDNWLKSSGENEENKLKGVQQAENTDKDLKYVSKKEEEEKEMKHECAKVKVKAKGHNQFIFVIHQLHLLLLLHNHCPGLKNTSSTHFLRTLLVYQHALKNIFSISAQHSPQSPPPLPPRSACTTIIFIYVLVFSFLAVSFLPLHEASSQIICQKMQWGVLQ